MPDDTAAVVKEIRLNVTGSIPGEALVVAILDYAGKQRETMSQENRDKWDALGLQIIEEWRALWRSIGVIK